MLLASASLLLGSLWLGQTASVYGGNSGDGGPPYACLVPRTGADTGSGTVRNGDLKLGVDAKVGYLNDGVTPFGDMTIQFFNVSADNLDGGVFRLTSIQTLLFCNDPGTPLKMKVVATGTFNGVPNYTASVQVYDIGGSGRDDELYVALKAPGGGPPIYDSAPAPGQGDFPSPAKLNQGNFQIHLDPIHSDLAPDPSEPDLAG